MPVSEPVLKTYPSILNEYYQWMYKNSYKFMSEFPTEYKELALRYNEGKPQLVFILDFPNAIAGLANVKEFGAKKYELHNWKRGRNFRDTISSLLRHLMACQSESTDKDSGLPHIDHVLWNAIALAEWYRTHPELNDWGPNLNE